MRGMAASCRRATSWVTVAGVLCLASVAFAGTGVWTSGGPYGGSVWALVFDPSNPQTVYVATSSGVFKSTDGGGTWTRTGLREDVGALAIDPTNPATLYAGGVAVFKTTDAGATWVATGGPWWVSALAIDPATPTTLYAATWGGGVFKSTDAAATWSAPRPGVASPFVYALVIDPTEPATLYAGTDSGGIFKSTDAGKTWFRRTRGLSEWASILALAIDPKNPATLYAGVQYAGVMKSTDAGRHWAVASTGLTSSIVLALAIDPAAPTTLYAGTSGRGVFKSTDAGGTWSRVYGAGALTSSTVIALAVDPVATRRLCAGTSGRGAFQSKDSGATWSATNAGLTSVQIRALAIPPATSTTLYAGAWYSGIFKSTDAGATWAPPSGGPMDLHVNTLAIDPADPDTIYAGTWYDGVFRSTDAGATWLAVNAGLTSLDVLALAIDPATPTTLYAGSYDGFFRSVDSGGRWTAVGTGLPYGVVSAVAIDPTNPAILYAGGYGVSKSIDAGSTWTEVLPEGTIGAAYQLVFDPTNPATLYAATYRGIFKSTDAARTWKASHAGLIVYALAIDPANPATLYAGTWDGGVIKSTDSGGTWSSVNKGLPYPDVRALALDPTGRTVYAGAGEGSVWQAASPAQGTSDLALTISDSPDPVIATRPLEYTLTVVNNGPDLSGSLVVSQVLPAGVAFDGAWGVGGVWTCSETAGVVTCLRHAQAAGTDSTIKVNVIPGLSAGVLTSSASVAAVETDPDPTNNSDSEATTVRMPPVQIGTRTKAVIADSGEFVVDGSVTYTITVSNTGVATQADNPGHELVDALPTSVALVSAEAASGTATADLPTNTVTWDGSLASGSTVTVTIHATIRPTVALGTVIANQAVVRYDFDGDGTNEAATPTDDPDVPGVSDPTTFLVVSPAMDFYTLEPCRLVDTRGAAGPYGGPPLSASDCYRVFPLFGQCGIPATARVISVNLTVAEPTAAGYLWADPADASPSSVPLLTYAAGETRANNALTALNGLGELAVRCTQGSGTVHLILDVNGCFW
jgi:uncharacterized repeat protein (TIGR01451 family)